MTAMMWRGILIPFLGTALGAACVFFMRKGIGRFTAPRNDRLCRRRNDGGFDLESADPFARAVGRNGCVVFCAAGGWILDWNPVSFAARPRNSAPAPKKRTGGGPKTDCAARRCLRSRCFCIIYRREWSSACFTRDLLRTARRAHCSRRADAFSRYRHPELSGRRNRVDAAAYRRLQ